MSTQAPARENKMGIMPINKLQGIRIIPTMVSMYLRSRVECFVTCKAHSSIS